MKNMQNDESFERVASRSIADMPVKITLPVELVSGMQNAWDNSFPRDQSQEQGGILVRHDDGSYKWKAGKPGRSGSFIPNFDDCEQNETLVAIGHTHPYDEKEGGYTDVSFSGRDLAMAVYHEQVVNIVQSGQTLFLVAPSAEFNKLVKNLDTKGKRSLFQKIERTWYQAFLTHQGQLPARADAATKATTATYHLVYYFGAGNSLNRTSAQKNKDTK